MFANYCCAWCYHLINPQFLDYYLPDLFPPQTINLSIYHCWCGNKFWQLKSSLKTILSSSQHCNQQPTLFCFTCKLYWLKETAYESSNFLRALALHSIDLEAKICWTVFNGVGVTDCYITIDYIILPFISFLILLQCQRVEVSHGEDKMWNYDWHEFNTPYRYEISAEKRGHVFRYALSFLARCVQKLICALHIARV